MVVISLLGILSALLLLGSSMQSRKSSARALQCRDRLKTLSQALFEYSGDHLSILPPAHDAKGLALLSSGGYLPGSQTEERQEKYLYYGGLMQIEFGSSMGMLRDLGHAHSGGGNTAFGDGHAGFIKTQSGCSWQQTDDFFQMDHRQPGTELRKLNRALLWSSTWTVQ